MCSYTAIDGDAYSTPTPSTNRADRPIPPSAIQIIPDSPSDEQVITNHDIDRVSTKSESPELRLSVHEVAPLEPQLGRPDEQAEVTDASVVSEDATDVRGESRPSQPQIDQVDSLDSSKLPPNNPLPAMEQWRNQSYTQAFSPITKQLNSRKTPSARRSGSDVFDPIESDTESFHERQHMFGSKRLRLSKTPTGPASLPRMRHEVSGSRRPEFKIPDLPKKSILDNARRNESASSSSFTNEKPRDIWQQLVTAADEGNEEVIEAAQPLVNGSSTRHNDDSITAQFELEAPKETSFSAQPLKPVKPEASYSHARPATGSPTSEKSGSQSSERSSVQQSLDRNNPLPQMEKVVPGLSTPEVRSSEPRHGSSPTGEIEDKANHAPVPDEQKDSDNLQRQQAANKAVSKASPERQSARQHQDIFSAQDVHHQDTDNLNDAHINKNNGEGYQSRRLRARKTVSTKINSMPDHQQNVAFSHDSKSKALKEQILKDQAERMNLATDGAKQLAIERRLKQTVNTPKANGWIGAKGQVLKNPPRTEAQKQARKLKEQKQRDEKIAAEKFRERTFGSAASNASVKSSQDSEAGGQAPTRENGVSIQRPANSREGSMARSSASNADSTTDVKRRTLTPLIPGSASSNKHRGPSPMSSKSANSNAGPLRSAMKQPSNSLRRSASQVSFGGSLSAGRKDAGTDNAEATPSKSEKRVVTPNPATSAAKRSIKPPLPQKQQATLNVNIDKKMKGRVIDPPSPIKASPEENADASSDGEESVSSYISEEDVGFGISKAGPSIRKGSESSPQAASEIDRMTSSIDPALQSLSQPSANALKLGSSSQSKTASPPKVQQDTRKRSPSQASGAITISSGSSSDFESSDSESEKEFVQPSLQFGPKSAGVPAKSISAPSQSSEESSTSGSNQVTGGAAEPAVIGSASRESSAGSASSSESSSKSSTGSAPAAITTDASAHNPHISSASSDQSNDPSITKPPEDASKQLHQETQESLKHSQKDPTASRGKSVAKNAGPGNFRYPSLSQLKREAEGKIDPRVSRMANGVSQSKKQTLDALDFTSDSDEDSESSSSVSTDPKIAAKSNSGLIPGMKGLLKRMLFSDE